MKHVLAAFLFAIVTLAPVAHAETWRDAVAAHVHDGFFGGYHQHEIATVAAQQPVDNDTLDLHAAFIGVWARALDEEPGLLIGELILEADANFQALWEEFGRYSTQDVRTRGNTGGF
jgi:hypothetical protein